MRSILVEVLVPGKLIDQSHLHPADRSTPQYGDDFRFKYTTLAKPEVGDLVHLNATTYRLKHVVQVLATMRDGGGTYHYMQEFQVHAEAT